MTTQEILDRAFRPDTLTVVNELGTTQQLNPAALRLACQQPSSEYLEREYAACRRRYARYRALTRYALVSAAACLIAALLMALAVIVIADHLADSLHGAFGSALLLTAGFFMAALVLGALQERNRGDLLAPISGTEYCERALKYLQEGGPLVAAWRDAALRERSQLHCFDAEIMGLLYRQYRANCLAEQENARLSNACQVVHKLRPDDSTLAEPAPPAPATRFRHFKGNEYTVRHLATEEASGNSVVIYQGEDGRVWSRSLDSFLGTVMHDGREVDRFQRLDGQG